MERSVSLTRSLPKCNERWLLWSMCWKKSAAISVLDPQHLSQLSLDATILAISRYFRLI